MAVHSKHDLPHKYYGQSVVTHKCFHSFHSVTPQPIMSQCLFQSLLLVPHISSFSFDIYHILFFFSLSFHLHNFLRTDESYFSLLDYDFGDIFPVLQSLPSADWEGGAWLFPPSPISIITLSVLSNPLTSIMHVYFI